MDGLTRWSKIVRGPGAVQILGHSETLVPAEAGDAPGQAARPGLRLHTLPVGVSPPYFAIDITSTAVIAMLEGFLGSGVVVGRTLTWASRGYGTRRRDTVHLGG